MEKEKLEAWELLLARMEQKGISFYLDGRISGVCEIMEKCCVCEDQIYMPDFVTDERGRLTEIRYDAVKEW